MSSEDIAKLPQPPNMDVLNRAREAVLGYRPHSTQWIKVAMLIMDAWPSIYAMAKRLNEQQAALRAQLEAPFVSVTSYNPELGDWFQAASVDEMQAFFRSRLPAVRLAARSCGYAIGVHGSERRDFDLIAVPWCDGCKSADELAHAIAQAACGITRAGCYEWEQKPMGRIATSIPVCWTPRHGVDGDGHIDLSVLPGCRS